MITYTVVNVTSVVKPTLCHMYFIYDMLYRERICVCTMYICIINVYKCICTEGEKANIYRQHFVKYVWDKRGKWKRIMKQKLANDGIRATILENS